MKKSIRFIVIIAILILIALSLGAMKKWELLPYVVIYGRVVDEAGKPIENANIAARFGLTYETAITTTGPTGRFIVSVYALRWDNSGKGPPSITVSKQGYREYWGYFVKRKSGGPTLRNVTVKLVKGPEELQVREDL
jgi:hypothetical protein